MGSIPERLQNPILDRFVNPKGNFAHLFFDMTKEKSVPQKTDYPKNPQLLMFKEPYYGELNKLIACGKLKNIKMSITQKRIIFLATYRRCLIGTKANTVSDVIAGINYKMRKKDKILESKDKPQNLG